jgi:addiction module RelB/DinJ family antitoxin
LAARPLDFNPRSVSALKPVAFDTTARSEHIRYMTEQVRYRIDKKLVRQAEAVCADLGLAPSQAVSMFFAQLVKAGGLPFRPTQFPALEEYGVTVAEAEAAEAAARRELNADEKAGRLVEFKGKLP